MQTGLSENVADRFLVFAIKLKKRKTKKQRNNVVSILSRMLDELKWETQLDILDAKGDASLLIGKRSENPKFVFVSQVALKEPHLFGNDRYSVENRLANKKKEFKNFLLISMFRMIVSAIGVALLFVGSTVLDSKSLIVVGLLIIVLAYTFMNTWQSNTNSSKDAALFSLVEFSKITENTETAVCFINTRNEEEAYKHLEEKFPKATFVLIDQLSYEGELSVFYYKCVENIANLIRKEEQKINFKRIQNEYDSIFHPMNCAFIISTVNVDKMESVFPGSKNDNSTNVNYLVDIPILLENLVEKGNT